jgi:hypothetical protein
MLRLGTLAAMDTTRTCVLGLCGCYFALTLAVTIAFAVVRTSVSASLPARHHAAVSAPAPTCGMTEA